MVAVDVGATVGRDGVEIKLPRLRVEIERRQAERLRDALNTVLPAVPTDTCIGCCKQFERENMVDSGWLYGLVCPGCAHSVIDDVEAALTARDSQEAPYAPPERIDLEHDPRVSDLQVLRAARALLAERAQDTESLSVVIDHIEASRNPKRCTLCRCEATDEVHGFQVCGYHVDHTEDDAPCPACNPPKLHLLSIAGDVEPELSGRYDNERERTEAAQDYRRAHGDEDGLFRLDIAAGGRVTVDTFSGAELDPARLQVAVGDRVRDAMDGGRWREIVRIDDGTAYMADGGCMSVAECATCEKRLPSEALP